MAATSTTQTAENEKLVAGWLTQDEFSVLEAVCETLLPSLEPPEGSSEAVVAYYRRSALDLGVAPETRTEASKTLLLLLTFEHIFVIMLLLGDKCSVPFSIYGSYKLFPIRRRYSSFCCVNFL